MVSQFERNKDVIQEGVETAARHVGNIAQIVSDAVVAVAREIGDGISDAIEMREAAQRAAADDAGSDSAGAGEEVDEEIIDGAAPITDTDPR